MYDDRITFTADNRKGGTYTYNAGADGMTYVNWGTSFNPTGAEPDVDVALGNQTSTWSFEVYDWEDAEMVTSPSRPISSWLPTLPSPISARMRSMRTPSSVWSS